MRRNPQPESPGPEPRPPIDFDPVPLRARRDGWTVERQIAFIEALAECGCVRDACRRVGMSAESAYALQRRPAAQSFRIAWEAALDYGVRRIEEAAFSRAIHGVAMPHYYKGELVGEHRRYDDRLAMFLLRCRSPGRYGRHRETGAHGEPSEAAALFLADAAAKAAGDAIRAALGGAAGYFTALPGRKVKDREAFLRDHYVEEPIEDEEEDGERDFGAGPGEPPGEEGAGEAGAAPADGGNGASPDGPRGDAAKGDTASSSSTSGAGA